MLHLSVIICTYNPNLKYLSRVFDSLNNQTLHKEEWELLIIDNGSVPLLSSLIDTTWHKRSRIVIEQELGLTPARLRGINEAHSDILLFVDDDNCLEKDYLEKCVSSFNEIALLGVLGAGKIIPEFEVEPSVDTLPFTNMLALRNEKRAHFSNEINWHPALPFGAGLCIRKAIALQYVASCKTRQFTVTLDRSGNALLSGGDIDMALHACKDGYIAGVTPELKLIHIIPKARLEKDYLVKLAAGHAFSHYILGRIWGYHKEYPQNFFLEKIRYFKKLKTAKGLDKLICMAEYKALKQAKNAWYKYEIV